MEELKIWPINSAGIMTHLILLVNYVSQVLFLQVHGLCQQDSLLVAIATEMVKDRKKENT